VEGAFIVFFASIPIVILAVGPGWFAGPAWKLIVPVPVAFLFAVAYGFIVARGLPRAAIGHEQLVPVSLKVARAQVSQAMGRRTMRFVLGSATLMTVIGLLMALITPSLTLWLSTGFFALCTISLYRSYRGTQ
jgi:hypothetical protein